MKRAHIQDWEAKDLMSREKLDGILKPELVEFVTDLISGTPRYNRTLPKDLLIDKITAFAAEERQTCEKCGKWADSDTCCQRRGN